MRFSKEKINELKAEIRIELVKSPDLSIMEIQEILCDNHSHKFDKNFVGKLKGKIHRERTHRYNSVTVFKELAKLEDLIRYGRQELVEVIFNKDDKYKPKEIINAFRTVIWAENMLLEAKLNAGIFGQARLRQEEETPLDPEQQDLLKRAIDHANERAGNFTKEHEQQNNN